MVSGQAVGPEVFRELYTVCLLKAVLQFSGSNCTASLPACVCNRPAKGTDPVRHRVPLALKKSNSTAVMYWSM